MSSEDDDLALALELSSQDNLQCSQSDAFLSGIEMPNRNRNIQRDAPSYDGNSPSRQFQRSDASPFLPTPNLSLYGNHRTPQQRPQPLSSTYSVPTPQSPRPGPFSIYNIPSILSALAAPQRVARQLMSAVTCSNCNQGIFGSYVTVMGNHFHPQCFVCAGCNGQLFDVHYPRGDPPLPYHKVCAEELFNDRCSLCGTVLRGQYLCHSFFEDEIYCVEHTNCRQCFSCNRKEPLVGKKRTEGFIELHDGRVSCLDCINTAIFDSSEALPLYHEALDFMERVLLLPMPAGIRDVPILAVDLPSLNEQQVNNRNEAHRSGAAAESITRGLTLSSIGHVTHMTAGSVFSSAAGLFSVGPPQVYRIEQVREITAVLVLFGLPRDLTASILAHEAMHVWMRLTKNIPYPLPLKLEEGLCQVVSRGYLENVSDFPLSARMANRGQPSSGADTRGGSRHPVSAFQSAMQRMEYCQEVVPSTAVSAKDKALRAYFCCQIEMDCSAIYGDGFREAQECVTALGLEIVLEVVRETKDLPRL